MGLLKGGEWRFIKVINNNNNILKQYNMFNIKKIKNLKIKIKICKGNGQTYIYRHNDSGIYSDT